MCTVTYLPQGDNHFLLTSNRDEMPSRSPRSITASAFEGQQLAFPRDEMAGGTWLAVSSADRLACLLNGAFERHDRNPPYRMSRGVMVLEYFTYRDTADFLRNFPFDGMEPFTMILYDRGDLCELKWDESDAHVHRLDPAGRYIWSSPTLYEPEVRRRREQWFADWLEGREDFSREAILHFHHHAGEGDPWNDVIMNRDGIVRTVSISSIVKAPAHIHFQYQDLLTERNSEAKIRIEGEGMGAH